MPVKPIIAITSGFDEGGNISLRRAYCRAVARAGGVPILLTPDTEPKSVIKACAGLILSGGGDIEPERYSSRAYDPSLLGSVSPERDEYELELARLAYKRNLPTLAICRGVQVMNVALGGDLHIDITSHVQSMPRPEPSHRVLIEPDARLYGILPCNRITSELAVNSFHHQALRRVAGELKVTARCPTDGIIEAVEASEKRFYLGVQWHPEHMESGAPLFSALVAATQRDRRR